MKYFARAGQSSYGQAVGVIVLEDHIPYPPGCPGNATTFSYPVRYEIARGVSIDSLKVPGTPESAQPFLEAGRALIRQGARAITGNCGLMVAHQEYLAANLDVPVAMSSLLQLPFVASLLAPGEKIGLLASSKRNLKPHHLSVATRNLDVPIVMGDMDGYEGFNDAVMLECGELDFAKVKTEVVSSAIRLIESDRSIKALIFECTDLPPYAYAVQQATGLPVFDIITMIDLVSSAVVRRRFQGHM
jgi:Asp/Glu/hydantoin racemase